MSFSSTKIQLPKSWPAKVCSAMLHVAALAKYAAVHCTRVGPSLAFNISLVGIGRQEPKTAVPSAATALGDGPGVLALALKLFSFFGLVLCSLILFDLVPRLQVLPGQVGQHHAVCPQPQECGGRRWILVL